MFKDAIIYSLPFISANAGDVLIEKDFDLEWAVSKFPINKQERAKKIGERYIGRQLDAMSVLLYSEEQGIFDEYAKKLEDKCKEIDFIHPALRFSRIDVSAFFVELYYELGIASKSYYLKAKNLMNNLGIGIVVLPKNTV